MSKFASQTQVSADRSRAEIEKEITRFGATGFVYGWQDNRALIEFIYKNKKIRFTLEMAARSSVKAPPRARGWNEKRANAS